MSRSLHPDWESWWKGWLVAAPVVGYGSTWLAKNQLFRIWKVSRGIADGTTFSEARELGLAPSQAGGSSPSFLASERVVPSAMPRLTFQIRNNWFLANQLLP